MKFETLEDRDLLKRLTAIPDFNHYVEKLVADYQKAVQGNLMAPPGQAECKRGEARALYLLLKALGQVD